MTLPVQTRFAGRLICRGVRASFSGRRTAACSFGIGPRSFEALKSRPSSRPVLLLQHGGHHAVHLPVHAGGERAPRGGRRSACPAVAPPGECETPDRPGGLDSNHGKANTSQSPFTIRRCVLVHACYF